MQSEEIISNRDLLQQVKSAISAIALTGQSYTIGSRSLTRANLTELRNLASELEAKVAAEESGAELMDNCYVAVFEGR